MAGLQIFKRLDHSLQAVVVHVDVGPNVPGVDVTFTASAGGLTPQNVSTEPVPSLTVPTGEAGYVRVNWTLPEADGTWDLQASVDWSGFGYSLAEQLSVPAVTTGNPLFYLAENGITVMCPDAQVWPISRDLTTCRNWGKARKEASIAWRKIRKMIRKCMQ